MKLPEVDLTKVDPSLVMPWVRTEVANYLSGSQDEQIQASLRVANHLQEKLKGCGTEEAPSIDPSALMLQLENFLFGYAAAFVRDLWNMMDELQPKVATEDAPRVLSAEEGRVAKILASKEAPEWLRGYVAQPSA
tara:strand:+ start:83 stop:487 length:405 start_codon:yes stop_codon:yes gene_type:complete